ncbi:3-phosphoshikimate 1-carboxyvinyltransferase [Hippea alviniae]|uniref:3-phosphoshikimate 1-carboxyvinyltransferase n=1 Tax=Hippea alviniae TaxID=1279027 RepID=UPI0003B625FD|nr:3-phosphoshikimate 1-carboxyvinyltransferase [Hippea alviniae]
MAKVKRIRPASDKSISHRAVIFSSISKGRVKISNMLFSDDTLRTIKAMQSIGVEIEISSKHVIVNGAGKYSLKEPNNVIDMGNSGTSARLISGLLSAQNFFSVITGDESLRKRPMGRVVKPLSQMGATILARNNNLLPMAIKGTNPTTGIIYKSPVASAQVKSAILLAGLYSHDTVRIEEPYKSRDHSENMLKAFGVDVIVDKNSIELGRNRELTGDFSINVPADISSAAFFMVYAALKENSEIILSDVVLNPTRSGILRVFDMASVDYEIINERVENFEKVGDILVRHTKELSPFTIEGELIPTLIDEIPILSILAVFCDGASYIRNASELRKKESDRIAAICTNLRRVGVEVEEFEDGFAIKGDRNIKLRPAVIDTQFDHRIAMSFSILKAVSGVDINISETKSISVSYPNFLDHLSYVSL